MPGTTSWMGVDTRLSAEVAPIEQIGCNVFRHPYSPSVRNLNHIGGTPRLFNDKILFPSPHWPRKRMLTFMRRSVHLRPRMCSRQLPKFVSSEVDSEEVGCILATGIFVIQVPDILHRRPTNVTQVKSHSGYCLRI